MWMRGRRQLRLVDNSKLKNHHDSQSSIVLAKLRRRTRLRIKVWGWLAEYAEAKWLEANGWTQVRNGWLLPEWHPHKLRAQAKTWRFEFVPGPGISPSESASRQAEPYSQNHAVNSQRYHCMCLQQPAPKRIAGFPHYPAYVRWAPYQLGSFAVSLLLFALSFSEDRVLHVCFCLALLVWTVIWFALSRRIQRDMKLDFTESKLRGE